MGNYVILPENESENLRSISLGVVKEKAAYFSKSPKEVVRTLTVNNETIEIIKGNTYYADLVRNDYLFRFTYNPGLARGHDDIFDQILSTFMFLDNIAQCKSNKDCQAGYFCDYSTPGGMGPNGYVTGNPYGTQKCIQICSSDSDCKYGKCTNFNVVVGDINVTNKGCQI